MDLIEPSPKHLTSYEAALCRGWSPSEERPEAAREQLEMIAQDGLGFVTSLNDPVLVGTPVPLPDGTTVPRLPCIVRWLWDGEFSGSIQLRWQSGTENLPPYCLGHIGYSIVPWKRRRGYATRALWAILPEARRQGLAFVYITSDPENIASQKIITANGGKLVERFRKGEAYGGGECLRFRINLD